MACGPYEPWEFPRRWQTGCAFGDEVGPERTGIRLSPYITQRNMADPDIIDTILCAAKDIGDIGLAYIHLSEADWDDAPVVPEDFRHALRKVYGGRLIVAGKYTKQRAQAILRQGLADLVLLLRSSSGDVFVVQGAESKARGGRWLGPQ